MKPVKLRGRSGRQPSWRTEAFWWPPDSALRWTRETPGALLLLWLAWRWGVVQGPKIRLLAMFHGAILWLGPTFGLPAISHGVMALTDNDLSLGLAPVHALTMGDLATTMLAMTTGLASGHGGRGVAADDMAWIMFWILQTAVVPRVLAALWPVVGATLTVVASVVWSIATVNWRWRYVQWFGRPRPDARPA